ncbi:unnamed protein product [Protopolystoma xenopodis]|uniref:Uncharacterized protein n=1 Tax=Protopolystoma xenopodis TaxID=117903 RepID=A0A448WCY6_9PLAT|nr:unnamed protein product [Protopolystoma xenopodis]
MGIQTIQRLFSETRGDALIIPLASGLLFPRYAPTRHLSRKWLLAVEMSSAVGFQRSRISTECRHTGPNKLCMFLTTRHPV